MESERAAASTMGVPAYEVLQSITGERGKKKTEGRGNEEIGSCVKVAERNQSSERRIPTSNNGFIFYWRSICCCHIFSSRFLCFF